MPNEAKIEPQRMTASEWYCSSPDAPRLGISGSGPNDSTINALNRVMAFAEAYAAYRSRESANGVSKTEKSAWDVAWPWVEDGKQARELAAEIDTYAASSHGPLLEALKKTEAYLRARWERRSEMSDGVMDCYDSIVAAIALAEKA